MDGTSEAHLRFAIFSMIERISDSIQPSNPVVKSPVKPIEPVEIARLSPGNIGMS